MTWYIWAFVVFLFLTAFGLGCITTRSAMIKRGEDKMFSNRRANAALSVFFTVVALFVAVDTVYLQVQFNRYVRGQVDCNTRQLDADSKITAERIKVDKEAAEYDDAMLDYLAAHQDRFIPTDDPVYKRVKDTLGDLKRERQNMVQVYAENPSQNC